MEEEQVNEDNNNNIRFVSPLSGFPMSTLPPLSIKNQTETVTFNTGDQVNNNGPTLPAPVFPTTNLSARADNYSDRTHERDSLSLSLSLSISVV